MTILIDFDIRSMLPLAFLVLSFFLLLDWKMLPKWSGCSGTASGMVLASWLITRLKTPVPSPYMFREPLNFLKCGGRLHSLRFWQHLSRVLCHVAETGTALLTHISHMGAIWTVLLTAMSMLWFVFFTPVLKQFRAGRLHWHSVEASFSFFCLLPSLHNLLLIYRCRWICEPIRIRYVACASGPSILRNMLLVSTDMAVKKTPKDQKSQLWKYQLIRWVRGKSFKAKNRTITNIKTG